MNRYILTLLIASLVTVVSCTGRKDESGRKGIIPEKDLTSILAEVYLADGLLTIPEVRYKFTGGDSLDTYIDIIERHGYTKQAMDNTMRYYFVSKPKAFLKIYDKVLGQLSEMESRVDKEMQIFGVRQSNIWPGKDYYSFFGTHNKDTAWIDYSSNFYGTLALKFTMAIFPDDQTVNPALGLWFSQTDTAGNETKVAFPRLPFIKDGHPRDYSIQLVQTIPGNVSLRGWFINPANSSPFRYNHYWVSNIILTRTRID